MFRKIYEFKKDFRELSKKSIILAGRDSEMKLTRLRKIQELRKETEYSGKQATILGASW